MPQALSKIYVHIIFSTKDRFAFLTEMDIRQKLYGYLTGTLKQMGSDVYIVGGTADHTHILCTLPKNEAVPKFIGEMKRSSSKWIKPKGGIYTKFAWQRGYGAFSISQSDLQRVYEYILNQEEHHRKMSFQEEFRKFLERYEVEFDERYVWD